MKAHVDLASWGMHVPSPSNFQHHPYGRYLENVPAIVPLLEKEYRNAAQRLTATQEELKDLAPDKLALFRRLCCTQAHQSILVGSCKHVYMYFWCIVRSTSAQRCERSKFPTFDYRKLTPAI